MGGPTIQGGMTLEERQTLLQEEEQMAMEREERQRAIMEEQEASRLAREEAQRDLDERAEEERVAEIERLESEGAEVSEYLADNPDFDDTISNLFSALATGTGFIGDDGDDETTEPLPE